MNLQSNVAHQCRERVFKAHAEVTWNKGYQNLFEGSERIRILAIKRISKKILTLYVTTHMSVVRGGVGVGSVSVCARAREREKR